MKRLLPVILCDSGDARHRQSVHPVVAQRGGWIGFKELTSDSPLTSQLTGQHCYNDMRIIYIEFVSLLCRASPHLRYLMGSIKGQLSRQCLSMAWHGNERTAIVRCESETLR